MDVFINSLPWIGLGLLVLVILFALWGFLAGLKRELMCLAIFIVVLGIGMAIFGGGSILMEHEGVLAVQLKNMLGVELVGEGYSVWNVILNFLQAKIPNGTTLFVEGREAYNLAYNITNGLIKAVSLAVVFIAVVVIVTIVRLIYHLVLAIIKLVKRGRARKVSNGDEDEVIFENDNSQSETDDMVIVLENTDSGREVVFTTKVNSLPEKEGNKYRIWGAIVGALKTVFVFLIIFAPISGAFSVFKNISDDTRKVLKTYLNEDNSGQLSNQESLIDQVFEASDAYYKSAIGKFVESSAYFFGDSFSSHIFDSALKIKLDKKSIYLRKELNTFISAVNVLSDGKEGNLKFGALGEDGVPETGEMAQALDILKESKLLPAVMPSVIEYLADQTKVKEFLTSNDHLLPGDKERDYKAFFQLRYVDWTSDIKIVLEAAKYGYCLNLLNKNINYLELDELNLKLTVDYLSTTEFLPKLLNIIVQPALRMDAVTNLAGDITNNVVLENIDWHEDLLKLVDIYSEFKTLGVSDISQLTNKDDLLNLIKDILINPENEKYISTLTMLETLASMDLMLGIAAPFGEGTINKFLDTKTIGEKSLIEFKDIITLTNLTKNDWAADFHLLLETAHYAYLLNVLEFDLEQIDWALIEEPSYENFLNTIENIFSLNILGSDSTKNSLLLASLVTFDLVSKDDVYENGQSILDKVGINWNNEVGVIKQLVEVYRNFATLNGVEVKIPNPSFNVDEILNDDNTVEVIVSALEQAVESQIVLELLPSVINHKLVPMLSDYEDGALASEIIEALGTKEFVDEIVKFVEALDDIKVLGLLKYGKDGASALNLDQIESMKNLINVVFNSKIFQGYEARIIRVIFKATKILDIPVELLDEIQYSIDGSIGISEQQILLDFIDQMAPILTDSEFNIVSLEDPKKFAIDTKFWTRSDISTQLISALKVLFGAYPLVEGEEVGGSRLIETLIKPIYEQIIVDIIDNSDLSVDIKDLVNSLDLNSLESSQLFSDIRIIVYIAEQAVNLDLQKQAIGDLNNMSVVDILTTVNNSLEAIHDLNILNHADGNLFAWTLNFASEKYLSQYNIKKFTADDFINVDWFGQIDLYKDIVMDAKYFFATNSLETIGSVSDFIKNGYKDKAYWTDLNASILLDIVNNIMSLQYIEVIAPVVLDVTIDEFDKNNVDLSFWKDQLSGEQLVSDVHSIVEMITTAINFGALTYLREGDMNIPSAEKVNLIVEKMFNLNLVNGYESKVFTFGVDYLLNSAKIDFLKTSDFNLNALTNEDWNNEVDVLMQLVSMALELINDNNIITIQEAVDFIKNQGYKATQYHTSDNLYSLADILRTLSDMRLVSNVSGHLLSYAIDELEPEIAKVQIADGVYLDLSLQYLKDVSDAKLMADLNIIANIIDDLADQNILQYIGKDNFKNLVLNTEKIAEIVLELAKLNLLTYNGNKLYTQLLNKGLIATNFKDFVIVEEDLLFTNWTTEYSYLASAISELGVILENYELVTINDVLNFMFEDKKLNMDNLSKIGLESKNSFNVAYIVQSFADMDLVKVVLPKFFDYGINYLYNNVKIGSENLDLGFLKLQSFTADQLSSDLKQVAEAYIDAMAFGLGNLILGHKLENSRVYRLEDALLHLFNTNIFKDLGPDWTQYLANTVFKLANFNFSVDKNEFTHLNAVDWNNDVNRLVKFVSNLVNVLEELDILSIDGVKQFINNKEYLELNTYNETIIDYFGEALSNMVGTNVLDAVLPRLVDFGTSELNKQGHDYTFLNNRLTSAMLENDIDVIIDILKLALELDFTKLENSSVKFDLTLDLDIIAQMVAKIENLEMYVNMRKFWASSLTNSLGMMLKMEDIKVAFLEYDFISDQMWESDNLILQDIFRTFNQLLKDTNITKLSQLLDFIKNKDYNSRQYLNEDNLNTILKAIDLLANIMSLQPVLPQVTLYGIKEVTKIDNLPINLSFLEEYLQDPYHTNPNFINGGMIANDLKTLISMLQISLDNDVLTLAYDLKGDIHLDVTFIAQIVADIENLNLFKVDRSNWLVQIINYGYELLKINAPKVTVEDFKELTTEADWLAENMSLQDAILALGQLQGNLNLYSYPDIKNFIDNKYYESIQYVNDDNILLLNEALKNIGNIRSLTPVLGAMFDYTLEQLYPTGGESKINIDLSFMKGSLTGKELRSDILRLTDGIEALIDFGIVDLVNSFNNKEEFKNKIIDLEYLYSVMEALSEMNIINNNYSNLAPFVVNELYNALKLDYNTTWIDFYNFSWSNDAQQLVNALDQLMQLQKDVKIYSQTELNEFISNKHYESVQYLNNDNLLLIANTLEYLSGVDTLSVFGDKLFKYALENIEKFDLTYLANNVNGTEILEDFASIAQIIKSLVELDVVDLVINKQININNPDLIKGVVDNLLYLNILYNSNNYEELIMLLLDNLQIDTSNINLYFNTTDERVMIHTLIDNIVLIARNQELVSNDGMLSWDSIKNFKNFVINSATSQTLDALAGIIEIIADDALFKSLIFPITEKYLTNEKLVGLVDLHNIYNSTNELTQDMVAIANVLRAVMDLDVYGFLNGDIDYPFDRDDLLEVIVSSLFRLNYLNNNGRMTEIINSVARITGMDLSDINGNNIDLVGDIDKIMAMYREFYKVLSDSDFPYHNKYDLQNKIDLQFFFRDSILTYMGQGINEFMGTTIYGELGGLVLLALVPLVKVVAPDYYDALHLNTLTLDQLADDADVIMQIYNEIASIGIINIKDGKVSISDLSNLVDTVISLSLELNMLDDSVGQLLSLVLRDFIYDRQLGDYYIPSGSFDVNGLDYHGDAYRIKSLIKKFVQYLENENIHTFEELNSFINSIPTNISGLLDNSISNTLVQEMLQIIAELDLVRHNLASLYDNIINVHIKDDVRVFLNYYGIDNNTIVSELDNIVKLVIALNNFGIHNVFNGSNIPYERSIYVEEVLEILADMQYLHIHLPAIIDKYRVKFEGFRVFNLQYEDLDVTNDLYLLIDAYNKLVPVLTSSVFPYKTLDDFSKKVNYETLLDVLAVDQNGILDAYRSLTNMSITPYFAHTAYNLLVKSVPSKYLELLNKIDLDSLTFEELKADINTSADIFENLIEVRILSYLQGQGLIIPEQSLVELLIDNIYAMNMIRLNLDGLVIEALDLFDINSYNVIVEDIDWDTEYQVLRKTASNLVGLLHEANIHTGTELRNFLKKFNNVSANEALKAIYQFLLDVNSEKVVEIVEALDESILLDQIFVPVYNKYLGTYVGKLIPGFENLGGYFVNDVANDFHQAAIAARSLYESEVYKAFTAKQTIEQEAVPFVQEAIKALSDMVIFELKKSDLLSFIDSQFTKLDFSTIDINGVNLHTDGYAIAELVDELYNVYRYSNKFNLTINMLGYTHLWSVFADLYNQLLDINLINEVLPPVFRGYVLPEIEKVLGTDRFNDSTNSQILSVLTDLSNAIYAMIEMGIFSDNGIDFTNTAAVQQIANVILNNVRLSEKDYNNLQKAVDNISVIGYVNLDYSNLSTENEINAGRDIYSTLIDFINVYKDTLPNDLTILADVQTQEDIRDLLDRMLNSEIVQQIFMPLLSGSVKILTKINYQEVSLFENMDYNEFMINALPDLFKMVNYANGVGLLDGNIKYKNTEDIMNLINIVVTSIVTKDQCPELFAIVFNQFLKTNYTADDFRYHPQTSQLIDYVDEAKFIEQFFIHYALAFEVPGVSIDDPESMRNDAFLAHMANAGREMINSSILQIVIKPTMQKVLNKVDFEVLDFLKEALLDPSYNDLDAYLDYIVLLDLIDDLVDLGYFSNSIDYNDLEPLVKVLENLFTLKALDGRENNVISMLMGELSFLDDITIDYNQLVWNQDQKDLFVEFVRSLAVMMATESLSGEKIDLNNVNGALFDDPNIQAVFYNFVEAASKCDFGIQVFPQLFEKKIEHSLAEEYQGVIDFDSMEPTDWREEFEKLFEIKSLLETYNYGDTFQATFKQVLEVYDMIFGYNSQNGLPSAAKNPANWLTRILKNTLPMPEGTSVNELLVENDKWVSEKDAVRSLIVSLMAFASEDTIVTKDIYQSVYVSTDVNLINDFLNCFANCYSIRTSIYQVITEMVNVNDGGDLKFGSFISNWYLHMDQNQEFTDYNNESALKEYNTNFSLYWDANELVNIASLIALANNMNLNVIDFRTVNATDLLSLLDYITNTKTFTSSALQGNDGIIAKFFVDNGYFTVNRSFGQVSQIPGVGEFDNQNWSSNVTDGENKILTDIIGYFQSYNLFGNDPIHKLLKGLSDPELKTLLSTMANSSVISNVLPEIILNSMLDAFENFLGQSYNKDLVLDKLEQFDAEFIAIAMNPNLPLDNNGYDLKTKVSTYCEMILNPEQALRNLGLI